MIAKDKHTEINRIPISVLMLYRICVLSVSLLLTLKTGVTFNSYTDLLLLGFGTYQLLALCMYWPVMKISAARLLLCAADLLIAEAAVLLTGSAASSFIPCIFIPIFTLHIAYGIKGAAGGLLALSAGAAAFSLASDGLSNSIIKGSMNINNGIILCISLILLYIVPFVGLRQYTRTGSQLQSLKEKYSELDNMNSKLLVLYEMTGRFNYENGIVQVMDRLLALCSELFEARSICIFLIRGGEVEIYGKPAPQEKEDIYQLIMEQKKIKKEEEEREYIIREDALVIPLIRGARTDGVLSFNGWKQREITNRDAILFSMIANMVCTYLENLEYVESLKNRLLPDTSVLLNHLESGKPVKGILDKRIVTQELE